MNKQLEKIQNVNITSEDELNSLLNEDTTNCCPKKKKRSIVKPPPVPIKRTAIGASLSNQAPPAKKMNVLPANRMLRVEPKPNYHQTKPGPKPGPLMSKPGPMSSKPGPMSSKPGPMSSKPGPMSSKPRNNDEIVCTPDIMGLFNDNAASRAPAQLPALKPPPLVMRQSSKQIRPTASANVPNPIYHTGKYYY
jgi:hypothetical protein